MKTCLVVPRSPRSVRLPLPTSRSRSSALAPDATRAKRESQAAGARVAKRGLDERLYAISIPISNTKNAYMRMNRLPLRTESSRAPCSCRGNTISLCVSNLVKGPSVSSEMLISLEFPFSTLVSFSWVRCRAFSAAPCETFSIHAPFQGVYDQTYRCSRLEREEEDVERAMRSAQEEVGSVEEKTTWRCWRSAVRLSRS